MQVGITNPLREFLRWKPFGPWAEEADPLFCWDAHRVVVDGRVMLVVCNAANRLAGVRAMRGSDWKRLAALCEELAAEAMALAGISEAAVAEYMERAGETELGRTHGRRAVAYMNRMVETLKWCECDHDSQFQPYLMHIVNEEDFCRCATRDDYGLPAAWMAEDLRAIGITPAAPKRSVIDYSFAAGDEARGDRGEGARLTDEQAIAELDSLIAEMEAEDAAALAGVAPDEAARREIDARIAAAEREMLAARGRDRASGAGCRVCGRAPRVYLDADAYCLDCYNELVERLTGIPHVTNDRSTLAVFDGKGGLVQFAVERMATPLAAEWVAREAMPGDDPRREGGYEGVEVSIAADPAADQDEVLAELWEKAQQAVSNPSTRAEANPFGRDISNGAHVGGEVRFANDSGWGRIDEDEHGRCHVVVDGRRYTGEQFLGLLSGHVGFNLRWSIADRTDPLSEP